MFCSILPFFFDSKVAFSYFPLWYGTLDSYCYMPEGNSPEHTTHKAGWQELSGFGLPIWQRYKMPSVCDLFKTNLWLGLAQNHHEGPLFWTLRLKIRNWQWLLFCIVADSPKKYLGCYEGAAAMEMKVLFIPDTEMTVDKCTAACFAADTRMAGK